MSDSAIDRLRGLLDVAAAVRTGGELRSVLEAVAGAIAGPLGYGAVVLNLFRPAWDDFEVVVVLGNEESQELLMGQTSAMEDWAGLLSDRFLRHGTYFIPAGEYDWDDDNVRSYTPALEVSDDPDAWHPDDALMVPLRSAEGALLGIVSVDEPVTGRRPSPFELELLSTVVANAAVAVEQAQTAELGRRHRAAVEHLLAVSAALTGRRSAEEMLDTICWGVREALGFHKVVIFLAEDEALAPLSGVGFSAERAARFPRMPVDAIQPLLDPELQRHGCVVMEAAEAERRTPPELHNVYSSVSNGRGPLAWDHHWVMVPLYDEDGDLDGMMWVDDPKDRLLPSDEVLQALRVFANQAMGAIESARRLERLEHLAAHDPLTGLRNRRGFELGIDRHLDALGRDGDLSCSSSTSTTSSESTTRWATTRATRSCGASPRCSARRYAMRTSPRGSGARSSRWCCPAPARAARWRSPTTCACSCAASSRASPAPSPCRSAWPAAARRRATPAS